MSASSVLELRSASFGYAGRAAVSGIDLTINAGEVVAVLGPNGSGKSTLMRGVLGLNDHLAGSVSLFGVPAADFHERTKLGYVPQRHTLSTSVTATVNEIVEVGRLPHRAWYRRATARDAEQVRSALARVGLADRQSADVATLSGGQQRRVLIARALAGEPEVLIMDEPTAGVDTASQEILSEVLQRLGASGVTMLIVTHELEALRNIVTRIVEISHGALSFDGTPAQWAEVNASRIQAADAGHHHPGELTVGRNRSPYGTGPFDEVPRTGEVRN